MLLQSEFENFERLFARVLVLRGLFSLYTSELHLLDHLEESCGRFGSISSGEEGLLERFDVLIPQS